MAIEITDLSKKYLINDGPQAMYTTLRETLVGLAKGAFQRLRRPLSPLESPAAAAEELWALKGINLKVEEGDRVGIIGRNGAGKTTLLKILSKITSPTSGQLKMRGRVSSLLEVGTGFHPELTGRENIYLNGAILGMKRLEINAKFHEIVAFAEIEKFLDTPVKRYSSGMIARLGFAIAAHLDPDILIVDEVLAVGDAAFQEKCLKKLSDLGMHGRTVLFVSHDISSIMNLCNKGVFLEKGCVAACGPIEACVSEYMRRFQSISMHWRGDVGDENIRFYSASLRDKGQAKQFFYQHEKAIVEIEYEILKDSQDILMGIGVWNQHNQLIARSGTFDDPHHFEKFVQKGRHRASFRLDCGLFHEGEYFIKVDCARHHHHKILHDEIMLKYPVYSQTANPRVIHSNTKTGIFLGNYWELNEMVESHDRTH